MWSSKNESGLKRDDVGEGRGLGGLSSDVLVLLADQSPGNFRGSGCGAI